MRPLAVEIEQLKRALVGPVLHLAPGKARGDFVVSRADHTGHQRFGHHQRFGRPLVVRQPDGDVADVGVDGDGRVADEGPRGRRPDQQCRLPGKGATREREAHVDAGVGDVQVAERDLVVGKSCAATRAVRRDPVVLHEQALVEDLLERPPHALDVAGVHGAVGLRQVDPVAHALGQLLERVDMPLDRLAAFRVELRDAVGLDVFLAGEAKLLFDLQLDGQAMAVPARLTRDVEALHGLEPREEILEHPCLDVVGAGHTVRGRRALVKGPLRAPFALRERAIEDLGVVPAPQHLVFEGGQVDLRRERGKGHR